MRSKKILHVWQGKYPWEVRVAKINQTLLQNKYQVCVLCRLKTNSIGVTTSNAQEKVIDTKFGNLKRISNAFTVPIPYNPVWLSTLYTTIRNYNYDIIIVRDIPLFDSVASVCKNIPLVLDMAEHYPAAMRTWDKYNKNLVSRFLVHNLKIPDYFERRAVSRANAILVVCDEQKDRVIQQYNVQQNKIFVVRNTPLKESLPDNKCETILSKKTTKDDFWFGYHGILCADRNLEAILKGFDRISEQYSNVRLLIAGSGESEVPLKRFAASLRSANKIKFTGSYNADDLPHLYSLVDCGIVSLVDNEFTRNTVANKFFDYPAHCKPFIYPDLKPLVRLAQHLPSGITFKAGCDYAVSNAMDTVIRTSLSDNSKDRELLSQSVLKSRHTIETQYNWSCDEQELLKALDHCLTV